jgi:hypothetical protein
MGDFATIATLSAFGWLSIARNNPIGAVLVIAAAYFLGVEHG